jgi:hypothetical protein
MHRTTPVAIVLAALLLATTGNAQAFRGRIGNIQPTTTLTAGQSEFAARYLAAISGRDLGAYRQLLHPGSLGCMRKAAEEYFGQKLDQRQGRLVQGARATIESLPPALALDAAAAGIGLRFPARPSHAFHFDLPASGTGEALVVFGVVEDGWWYEVLPCPSDRLLGDMRAARAQAAKDSAGARKLLASMQDTVRAELVGLIREGRLGTAMRRYSEVAGVQPEVARRVIELLEATAR